MKNQDAPDTHESNGRQGASCKLTSVQTVFGLIFIVTACIALAVFVFVDVESDQDSGPMPAIDSGTFWVPSLDADANSEQMALYDSVRPYLPTLSTTDYPNGTVRVYMFGSPGDRTSCTDNLTPLYWVWYSTVHLLPILTGFTSNGCAANEPSTCPNDARYSGSFYSCAISGVNHNSYTHSGLDRGHLVNSQGLARIFGASCQTFNMCNIAPQSPQMNQRDWLAIEELVQVRAEATALLVMQGSLINSDTDREPQCVCGSMDNGTLPCAKVVQQGDCNAQNWQIRMPYGFFKTVIDIDQQESWSFLYTKSQSEVGPQPSCSGVCESPQDAFLAGSAVTQLETAAHFTWGLLASTAQSTCSWCEEFDPASFEARSFE